MSISPAEYLNLLAKQIQNPDEDLEYKVYIYESVKTDTDNFKNNIPPGCEEAISTIKTLGFQAKLFLEAQETKRSSKEDVPRRVPPGSRKEIGDENNLTNRTIRFLSDNSGQIMAGASSVALGILGALYYRVPYPVRAGALGGSIAFLGAKSLLERYSSDNEPDALDEKEVAASKKIKAATLQSSSLIDNKNAISTAIAVAALSILLLNPKDRNINDWFDKGDRLYSNAIKELELEEGTHLDIEEIKKADLFHPETILDPKILKPNNDLNILRNKEDLRNLINALKNSSNKAPIGAIITRPPETYAIFYNPESLQFIFIDSRGREDGRITAQIFRSVNDLVGHLLDLRPIDNESIGLPELYDTETGTSQNPNACEIRILRKKEKNSKGAEIEPEEEITRAGKREKVGKPLASQPSQEEEDRLIRAEEQALECALRLSTDGSRRSSSSLGEIQRDKEPQTDSPRMDSCDADELVAQAIQEEEEERRAFSSQSSPTSPSIGGDPLDDEEALVQMALKASLQE